MSERFLTDGMVPEAGDRERLNARGLRGEDVQNAGEEEALVHHQTFRADHTYHLINEADKETIPMAWWNGPALIATCRATLLYICAISPSGSAATVG